MLTRQGAVATAVSVALVVAGRFFAIFELFVAGAGGAALVIAAVAFTGRTRLRLDVSRALHPPRLHAGQPATVRLSITNRSRRRTPVLQLRDTVGGRRVASVVLSPLAPGERVEATYSLPGEGRGRTQVGPLVVRLCDPFGLAAVSAPGAPVVELVVWPAVEAVLAPRAMPGHDRDLGAPATVAPSGDEFYALRPYADGDDLRRVHWRASARRDDLVVRQDERPGRSQVSVVLDTRTGVYSGLAFERAVAAAASIALAASRDELDLRLVTTAGYDSGACGRGSCAEPIETILDHLALVEEQEVGHVATTIATVQRGNRARGNDVVVVTGDGRRKDPAPSSAPGTVPPIVVKMASRSAPSAGMTVVIDETTAFAPAWNRAVAARRAMAGT